jgi:hypothetical protein
MIKRSLTPPPGNSAIPKRFLRKWFNDGKIGKTYIVRKLSYGN